MYTLFFCLRHAELADVAVVVGFALVSLFLFRVQFISDGLYRIAHRTLSKSQTFQLLQDQAAHVWTRCMQCTRMRWRALFLPIGMDWIGLNACFLHNAFLTYNQQQYQSLRAVQQQPNRLRNLQTHKTQTHSYVYSRSIPICMYVCQSKPACLFPCALVQSLDPSNERKKSIFLNTEEEEESSDQSHETIEIKLCS